MYATVQIMRFLQAGRCCRLHLHHQNALTSARRLTDKSGSKLKRYVSYSMLAGAAVSTAYVVHMAFPEQRIAER